MKKMLSWGTPKKIQAEMKAFNSRSIPAKKKPGCKKSEDRKHSFELTKTKVYKWYPTTQGKQTRVNEYHCLYCGKKRVDFVEEKIV